MEQTINRHGQPVGVSVGDWTPPRPGFPAHIDGRTCRLERLTAADHAAALHGAYTRQRRDADWTYLAYGPFEDAQAYGEWVASVEAGPDPLFYAILEQTSNAPLGVASYLRISPGDGAIEVGHIHFAPPMQGTTMATEAMYLMMATAFAMGFRRYEWKCDALNAPSRRAALRLGFTFEGVFRKATVVKGRNRDTAWYAITDDQWPAIRQAMESWLDAGNFDADGRQRQSLSDLIEASRARS